MNGDFGGVVIHEMPDAMMWNAPQLRPIAQCGNRGLLAFGENPTEAEADNVGKLVFDFWIWCFHARALLNECAHDKSRWL